VKLRYMRSVGGNGVWPKYGINDVVEGATAEEFYVTNWKYIGLPENGLNNPDTWWEKVYHALEGPVVLLFDLSLTRVFHCSWGAPHSTKNNDNSDDAVCAAVTGYEFQMANGITISNDRAQVFVADTPRRRISVREAVVQPNGQHSLVEVDHILLPHIVDNIEMEPGISSTTITMGTIPNLWKAMYQMAKSHDQDVACPGGMIVARREEKNGGSRWVVQDAFNHDGSKLSQISSAVRVGSSRVVLGSFYGNGVLMCNVTNA